MDIECCVCDMDGTLLNSQGDISEANVRALRQLKEKGVELVLATGRSDLYVKDVAHRLGVTAPIISANGAMIRRLGSSEALFYKYLPQDYDRRLAEACFIKNYDCIIYSSDLVFHRENSNRVTFFRRYNDRIQPAFRVPLKEINGPDDLPLGKLIEIFLWNITAEQIAELAALYNQDRQLTMVSSEKNGLDIVPQGISKGAGLCFLSQKLGFNLQKTAVLGDNYNDISMMKAVGIPIAVANAEQEVQQTAKFVTRSNDEDGVAYAIKNYILA